MSQWTPEMKAAGEQVRARFYQIIVDNPGITSRTIADLFGMPLRTVGGHLTILSRAGKVLVRRGKPATRRRPRGPTKIYPVDASESRAVNKGGAGHATPMPDDAEHRAWMAHWKGRYDARQTLIMAMRGRV